MPSWTHSAIDSSSASRSTEVSGPAAHDGRRRPSRPVVRASSAGAQRDEVEGGVQQPVGDGVGVLQGAEVGDVAQQALGGGLGGQAAELLDARAEGGRALPQVLEV